MVYKGVVKTAPLGPDGKPIKGAEGKVIGRFEFEGPKDKAELDKGLSDKVTVTIIAVNADGTDKAPETGEFDNFDAWEYGAGLKANQLTRKACEIAKAVTDHVLTFGNQKNDLDSKNPQDLAGALNKIAEFVGSGFDIGVTNSAKVADKVRLSLEQGVIHQDAKGAFVAGPAPQAPADKANGKAKK